MFASKTPRDLNDDPEPYCSTAPDFERYSNPDDYEGRHGVVYDPRPEFDHVQQGVDSTGGAVVTAPASSSQAGLASFVRRVPLGVIVKPTPKEETT